MRIWLLTSELAHEVAGGIARYVDSFGRLAGAAGHEVLVLGRAETACDLRPSPGVRVIGFESRASRLDEPCEAREPDDHPAYPYNVIAEAPALSFELAERVIALLEAGPPSPDLIECPESAALPYFLLQRKLTGQTKLERIPIVVHLHGSLRDRRRAGGEPHHRFPDWWTGELERACLLMADSITTTDRALAERARGNLGPAFDREITIVPDSPADRVTHFERKSPVHRVTAYPALQTLRKHRFKPVAAASAPRHGLPGLLSVVIPFFNLGATVRETIASVRASIHRPVEMILVDDGSTDVASMEALAALERESASDLTIVRSANCGVALARNLGAERTRGEYLCFLDADDCVEPRYFERCIDVLRRYANVDFVTSWVRYFGDAHGIWPTFDASFPYLLGHNACTVFSVMRRSAFDRGGGWNPAFEFGLEDHAFWIGMLASGAVGVALPEPLVRYRVRAGSITRRLTPAQQMHLHERMSQLHPELYREFGVELFNLQNANGPARLWDHPACDPPAGDGPRGAAGPGRRLMQRVKRTSLYRWYARRRNGPESA